MAKTTIKNKLKKRTTTPSAVYAPAASGMAGVRPGDVTPQQPANTTNGIRPGDGPQPRTLTRPIVVAATETIVAMQQQADALEHKIEKIETGGGGAWKFLTAPLTSTAWDGDSHSTTAKTLIDLSTEFGIPDYVKAILVRGIVQDSGAASGQYALYLAPNATAGQGICFRTVPANDYYSDHTAIVPCDLNGDIYYQVYASGSGTFDVILQIWGYVL